MSVRKQSDKKLFDWGVLELTNRNGKEIWKPKCKSGLIFNDDLEILDSYNREIVGSIITTP